MANQARGAECLLIEPHFALSTGKSCLDSKPSVRAWLSETSRRIRIAMLSRRSGKQMLVAQMLMEESLTEGNKMQTFNIELPRVPSMPAAGHSTIPQAHTYHRDIVTFANSQADFTTLENNDSLLQDLQTVREMCRRRMRETPREILVTRYQYDRIVKDLHSPHLPDRLRGTFNRSICEFMGMRLIREDERVDATTGITLEQMQQARVRLAQNAVAPPLVISREGADRLGGNYYDSVIIDEAAFIPSDVHWQREYLATTATEKQDGEPREQISKEGIARATANGWNVCIH